MSKTQKVVKGAVIASKAVRTNKRASAVSQLPADLSGKVMTAEQTTAAVAAVRSGYGAIKALTTAILNHEVDGKLLFAALEADAKANGEGVSSSKVVRSIRSTWSFMKTGKGLSFKDGEVKVTKLDASKDVSSTRAPRVDAKASGKKGKSANKAAETMAEGGAASAQVSFDEALAALVQHLSVMTPSDLNAALVKVNKAMGSFVRA